MRILRLILILMKLLIIVLILIFMKKLITIVIVHVIMHVKVINMIDSIRIM